MKLNVALIYGGEGFEHEISLVGAKNLSGMINALRYSVIHVLISKSGEWFIEKEGEKIPVFPALLGGRSGLFANGKIIPVDVAIPLLHGDLGEDGVIQGALRAAHIKFVGCDLLAGALAGGQGGIVGLVNAGHAGDVLLGDHQHMGGCLGIDVAEGVDLLVLVNLGGGDVTGDDLAEKTVVHGEGSFLIPWLSVKK